MCVYLSYLYSVSVAISTFVITCYCFYPSLLSVCLISNPYVSMYPHSATMFLLCNVLPYFYSSRPHLTASTSPSTSVTGPTSSTSTRSATISRTTYLQPPPSFLIHSNSSTLPSRHPPIQKNSELTPVSTVIHWKSFLPIPHPWRILPNPTPRIELTSTSLSTLSISTSSRLAPSKILHLHHLHLFRLQDPTGTLHLLRDRPAHLWNFNIFEIMSSPPLPYHRLPLPLSQPTFTPSLLPIPERYTFPPFPTNAPPSMP